jgi:uncharacterized protein (TIGR02147 family)
MAPIHKKPAELLSEAAARLKRRAPGMTVRALAARLKVSPSYLSKILRGKKPISQSMLSRLVKALGLDSQQIAQLQRAILEEIENEDLVPATGIRTSRLEISSPVESYRNLERGDFWILSEWFYIPILNLLTVTEFAATPGEIAGRLGISQAQAARALLRLEGAGLLAKNSEGRVVRTEEKIRFPTDRSLPEIRRYHLNLLQKAREELARPGTEAAFPSRLISSVSFVGPKSKFPEAKLIIEEAMYRVANLMADEPVTDEVFHLGLQFFPLTKPKS